MTFGGGPATMQAAQLNKYDKNFKLEVKDIPMPTPTANEVLVQVKFAAVNPLEMFIEGGMRHAKCCGNLSQRYLSVTGLLD